MADALPPPGPPPPKVPAGWKAVWNNQYNEWFYVNIYTKKSQWDKPTEPIYPPGDHDLAPDGPPPSYVGGAAPLQGEKTGLSSNNPYAPPGNNSGASTSHDISEDERYARQLQEEENARAQGLPSSRGAADGYYNTPQGSAEYGGPQQEYPQQGYPQQGYPPPGQQPYGQDPYTGQYEGDKGKKKSGLSSLLGKLKGSSSGSRPHSYGQPAYGPQPGYGAAPYGYGGRPMGGGMLGGGRKPGGGMGMAGGAALGAAGGLAGGMLLAEGLDGHDGGDDGGYGGDDGGGDGGGDFGGDGGGDFGGGDGGGDF